MNSLIRRGFSSFLRSSLAHNYPQNVNQRFLNVTAVDLAARKGTREKAKKKKVKVEIKKLTYMEKVMRAKKVVGDKNVDRHAIAGLENPEKPVDDVYYLPHYQPQIAPIQEALKTLRMFNDSSMYNFSNAPVNVKVEINMQAEKKTRFKENFTRTALVPHSFQTGITRTILVFCNDPKLKDELTDAGASYVGGNDLIKAIQVADIKHQDFEFVLAHSDMITDIMPLRGILKRRFPNPLMGTADTDIVALVKKYMKGIQYKSLKDADQKNFGLVEVQIGMLDMDLQSLEENFAELIKDINTVRPKRSGLFITRCYVSCPPSDINIQVDPFLYVEREKAMAKSVVDEEDDDDEPAPKEKQEAAA